MCFVSLHARFMLGGTQIWFGRGVLLEPHKPLPIFKGHFGSKRYPLLRIFLKIGPFFTNFAIFGVFAMQKPENLHGHSQKIGHILKVFFFFLNGTHV